MLSAVQNEIINVKENLIVSASAGTGKTYTLVEKMTKELEDNHTHKVVAAITFTIKAAKEIKDRLRADYTGCFIGTNNSFAIEEIIKPFIRDVYEGDFHFDISSDYSVTFSSFDECLDYLKNRHTICSYDDNKKNFVFELALKIVKQSKACRLFLKAKYFKIYVDEYQDCDKTMHEFFMFVCKQVGIPFFIVGDDKQSIYMWRGAYPEAFKSIMGMSEFQHLKLRDNYRSCLQIQNYSNLLCEDTRDLYSPLEDNANIIFLDASKENWAERVCQHLDFNKECALLRFSNVDAKQGAEMLSKSGTEFTYVPRTPISDITTDVSWLYLAIAQFFILPKYSVYDFMDEIPEESIGDRRIKCFLEKELSEIKECLKNGDDQGTIQKVNNIASYFHYAASEDDIRKMVDTIIHMEYHSAFVMDELKHVAITFHSSKGLEYEQVVVIANDYTLNKEDSIYNHYVAVTRAKSKLIIVRLTDEKKWAGDLYFSSLSSMLESNGLKPEDIMQIER